VLPVPVEGSPGAGVHVQLLDGGQDDPYRLSLAWCGEDPAEALVLTDADGLFGMAVDLVRLMRIPALVPPFVVVGIGYSSAATITDTIAARTRDFTPTAVAAFPGSGGAAPFRAFLRSRVLPRIGELVPSVGRTTYFGHSLGGLFGVHDLLAADRLFERHLISSPSLWWEEHALLDAELGPVSGEAYVGIGSEETDDGRRREAAALPAGDFWKPPAQRLDMVSDLERFAERLARRAGPSLRLRTAIFPGEYHATAAPIALTRGLRWLHEAGGDG
jgi:hypothetical protein